MEYELSIPVNDCPYTIFTGEILSKNKVTLVFSDDRFSQESCDLQYKLDSSLENAVFNFYKENRRLCREELAASLFYFCRRQLNKHSKQIVSYIN